MGLPYVPNGPGWAITPPPTAFGTVIDTLIPPYSSPKEGPALLYGLTANNKPNWWKNYFTKLTTIAVTCSTTANVIYVLRPLNWTTFSTAIAKNATAITLSDDPGVYSTNYRYPLPGQAFNPPGTANPSGAAPTQVADAAISSTNKYVAYQLDDGTWQLDTIASGTFTGANLTLTTGTPNRNGGTIAAGRPLFYFGAVTLSNPATGYPHLNITPVVSVTQSLWTGDMAGGGIPTLNAGDPVILHNPNATATTTINIACGIYSAY